MYVYQISLRGRKGPGGALIWIADVCDLLSGSRATIYSWVSEGNFSPPVRVSKWSVRWKIDEIEAWRDAL